MFLMTCTSWASSSTAIPASQYIVTAVRSQASAHAGVWKPANEALVLSTSWSCFPLPQALNEALVKAFPEYPPHDYPWPGHEEKMKVGRGGGESKEGGQDVAAVRRQYRKTDALQFCVALLHACGLASTTRGFDHQVARA
jgi:hypothetical protein